MIRAGIIAIVVVLTALSLAAGVAAVMVILRWRAGSDEPPTLTVAAACAGFTASEVEKAVARPIEEQLNGVEVLRRLHSRSWHDGSYRLEISLAPGTDLEAALLLIQDRIALALPALPKDTLNAGVTIRKGDSGPLMIICVLSPDGRFDAQYLGRYATGELKDELARLPGVAEVTVLGASEYVLRMWLDAAKLKARELTAGDVAQAFKEQNVAAAAGLPVGPGGELTFTLAARAGLIEVEQIEAVVIKTDPVGRTIRLRDVARVELGLRRTNSASLDGKDGAALVVYPLAHAQRSDVRAGVQAKLTELHRRLPDGVDTFTGFDFAPEAMAKGPGYLVLDVDPPIGASAEFAARTLTREEGLLRQLANVRNVLALSEQPFDRDRDQACLLVALAPSEGKPVDHARLMRKIPAGLIAEETAAFVRMRDVSENGRSGRLRYPVALAIIGPDRPQLQELAGQLAARMSQDQRLTDVWASQRVDRALAVDIDRTKAAALDLDVAEILASLEAAIGPAYSGETRNVAENWRFRLPDGAGRRTIVETLNQLKVRTRNGQMVPLQTIAALREVSDPAQLDRIDLQPAISITANPALGLTLAEARFVCERLAAEVLPKQGPNQYRLVWLREMPVARGSGGD
jgi:multidrug efflux pump subunit AcrB